MLFLLTQCMYIFAFCLCRLTRYKSFKEGHKRILVATDLVGRGIDIERVNIVINYDMPDSADTYLHQGRFSFCSTLFFSQGQFLFLVWSWLPSFLLMLLLKFEFFGRWEEQVGLVPKDLQSHLFHLHQILMSSIRLVTYVVHLFIVHDVGQCLWIFMTCLLFDFRFRRGLKWI